MAHTGRSSAGTGRYYTRLVFAFVFLAVLMLVVFTVLFNESRQNVRSIGHLNSEQMAQDLKNYLIEEVDEISLAAQTVEVMQDIGKTNADILEYLTFESRIVNKTIDENYTGIYGYINGEYMDGSGWVPDDDYSPTERPWYRGAFAGKGKVVYITPYIDSETGSLMVSICKLLSDRQSVVSLDVSLDRIQKIVESDHFREYDQIFVTDKDNIVVAALDSSLLGEDISDNSIIKAFAEASARSDSGDYFTCRAAGERYTVFTSMVEDQWNVFLCVRSTRLMLSLYYIYAILAAGIVGFIAFVALSFRYLNRRRKAAENLNRQLESIADIYVSVHRFDIEQNTIEEIRSLPYIREMKRAAEQTTKNSCEILEKVMKALVRDEHWEDMKAFIDLNTLDIRMGGSNSISIEILGIHGWIKARIIVLERKNDKISSFLWMVENIDKEKRKQNELRYLSETDLMTGIRNRGSGERMIKEQLRSNTGGMFCLMDADHFKSINDNLGHDVGDEVIRIIADRLRSSFRTADIVLRLGGDEFAVYAPGIENPEQADIVLARFLSAIEQAEVPAFRDDRKIELSIGVSFVSADNRKDFEVLYREADRAAYRSKKTPGSCISFYDKEIDQ